LNGQASSWRGRRGYRWSRRSTAGSIFRGHASSPADAGVARRRTRRRPIRRRLTVVHNGLSLANAPFDRRRSDALCFVGRVAREKGVVEAIEIAGIAGRPLRIAAKVAPTGAEREFHDEVFVPALKAAGSSVEFLGEVSGPERDELFAGATRRDVPGCGPSCSGSDRGARPWHAGPRPARGGLPEIIRDGVDGASATPDRVSGTSCRRESLDRRAIRKSVIERFSATRMADGYEALYRRVLGGQSNGDNRRLVDLKKLAPAQPHKAG
jgi:glycosyltransferase involved in cell wall biosynthesis